MRKGCYTLLLVLSGHCIIKSERNFQRLSLLLQPTNQINETTEGFPICKKSITETTNAQRTQEKCGVNKHIHFLMTPDNGRIQRNIPEETTVQYLRLLHPKKNVEQLLRVSTANIPMMTSRSESGSLPRPNRPKYSMVCKLGITPYTTSMPRGTMICTKPTTSLS